jgi:hypothetical protein
METQRIKELLDKYWAGESSLEEESQIADYYHGSDIDSELLQFKPLFNFYRDEKKVELERSIESMLPKQEAKIFTINRVRAVAATLAIIVASVFGFNYLQTNPITNNSVNATVEVQDPEEAYALTMEALAYLSSNYEKGSTKLRKLPKAMESTIIFK